MQRKWTVMAATALMMMMLSAGHTIPTASAQDSTPADERTFDLSFEGGTVADYARQLRRTTGGANIIVMPQAAAVHVPAMELTSVDLHSALYVLDDHVEQTATGKIQLAIESHHGPLENSTMVYTVQGRMAARLGQHQAAPASSIVSIQHIVQSGAISADDVLTAVETALDLLSSAQPAAQIRFHEATGLIIAHGTQDQLATIHNVVDELEGAIDTLRRAEQHQQRDMQERLEAQEAELADQRQRLEAIIHEMTTWQTRYHILEREAERSEEAHRRMRDEYEQQLTTLRQQLMLRQGAGGESDDNPPDPGND